MARTSVALLLTLVSLAVVLIHQPAASRSATAPQKYASEIPGPADILGFTPGDDRKLASWDQVINYFRALAKTSDRIRFEELGKSTLGKPFVMATISSPENLAQLKEFKEIQSLLADPRKLGPLARRDQKAAKLIERGKTVVLITCGIHSTEVGSYLSSMLIAHRLVSSNEPEIQNVLRNTIVLLVPSLNPDGVDIVKDWYDKTVGTPYEGTSPPELYHKYTGHDDNRDWYAFTQVETQIAVDQIHNVWRPQIVYDIHQQGQFGSRLFVPPYMAPVEPNVPPQIVIGYTELGNYLAREMRTAGFQGITNNSTYDAWSPSRAYSHYHGGVRILSETASCKIATPITIKFEQLRKELGYDPKTESPNFGPVWRGGEWHLRDITNYMTTTAFLLLKNASDDRAQWLQRFYEIGKAAVRPKQPFAFIIPKAQHQADLIAVLDRADVEMDFPLPFTAGGIKYPQGTAVVRLDQPYGAFAKAILERQRYPDLRNTRGEPISPYDVTAHDLALLMGVDVRAVARPFRYRLPKATGMNSCTGFGEISEKLGVYKSHVSVPDEGWTRWVLDREHYQYASLTDADIRAGNLIANYNSIVLPDQSPGALLKGYTLGTMRKELTGGIGEAGVKALREFVEQGGTLICLNRASQFAIEQLKLPVRDLNPTWTQKEFFVPGSILQIELDTSQPLARGMPKQSIAWVEDSPIFEVAKQQRTLTENVFVNVVARYPANSNPLLSGWLLGAENIKGRPALVEVKLRKGRVILFGFRPQYRGQSLATFPLLFNAIERQH
ncbi:MAG TPA: M14 metallopeptidase family protein [Pyrinomonadaceae bacterium]|nr:M14 metallopeptidase family protein [Pyrinomonadaceae bacterium]